MSAAPVLEVRDLVVVHRSGGASVHAASGVSFTLARGETLGVVGESGCGKSSVARAVAQLPPPTSGSVRFDGVELTELDAAGLRRMRARFQMMFQDSISSLNPRRKVQDVLAEPLEIWEGRGGVERRARIEEMLVKVGLDPAQVWDRRRAQLSGGQCQRICIARALMLETELLICDEPVSALDVSVQAQILNLLADLKADHGLSMLFVAHDLAVVHNVSNRVMVMYLGTVCEVAPVMELTREPLHPYTRVLVASVPGQESASAVEVHGEPPSPMAPPSGCRFRTRCPLADERCAAEVPPLRELRPGHVVACHHAE